ncbi:DUF3240 domain-containing protein [Helicobacter sp. MIT 05-5293]|uniref:DUF3240 family protein n=1 Tax=Helicobacter sp. MIT 05-5293 TaxID=1548149 RepID=UPI00051D3157|nr:DUF3240 family protein [Helicobacter sp. MIT 05-5293]TLD80417.1 DUF3240 domain-containing protein [Helicobacter sp. MIT 05-5293]
MQQQKIEIYFKHTLKDSIVDMLLEDGYDDFFYIHCAKYASSMFLASPKEQVGGRQEYGIFRIFLTDDDKAKFIINKLLQAFGKEHMKIYTYWVESH